MNNIFQHADVILFVENDEIIDHNVRRVSRILPCLMALR